MSGTPQPERTVRIILADLWPYADAGWIDLAAEKIEALYRVSAPPETQPDADKVVMDAIVSAFWSCIDADDETLVRLIHKRVLDALAAAGLSITPTDRLACADGEANIGGVLHTLRSTKWAGWENDHGECRLTADVEEAFAISANWRDWHGPFDTYRAVPVGEEPDQETPT